MSQMEGELLPKCPKLRKYHFENNNQHNVRFPTSLLARRTPSLLSAIVMDCFGGQSEYTLEFMSVLNTNPRCLNSLKHLEFCSGFVPEALLSKIITMSRNLRALYTVT